MCSFAFLRRLQIFLNNRNRKLRRKSGIYEPVSKWTSWSYFFTTLSVNFEIFKVYFMTDDANYYFCMKYSWFHAYSILFHRAWLTANFIHSFCTKVFYSLNKKTITKIIKFEADSYRLFPIKIRRILVLFLPEFLARKGYTL